MSNNLPAGVTDAMIDTSSSQGEQDPSCAACHDTVDPFNKRTVETTIRDARDRRWVPVLFCNPHCHVDLVWSKTTPEGKRAILSFLAACQLIVWEDVAKLAPAVEQYELDTADIDEFDQTTYAEMRKCAEGFLKRFADLDMECLQPASKVADQAQALLEAVEL